MTQRLHRILSSKDQKMLVFLPDCWMKLVKPKPTEKLPLNMIKLIVSPEMSASDVREYLKKVYALPVRDVLIRVEPGKMIRALEEYTKPSRMAGIFGRVLDKEPDRTVAFVTLRKDFKFVFPKLFTDKIFEQEQKQLERMEKATAEANQSAVNDWKRHGVPLWFK